MFKGLDQGEKKMNDVLTFIKSRRSTRKFLKKEIEEELLEQIIEAGRYAPSGGNSQSCQFLVISNEKVLNELIELVQTEFAKMEPSPGVFKSIINSIALSKKGIYKFDYEAPVLIVVANDRNYGNNMADSACALENMMLMANALDLGSCWINQLRWLNDNENILTFLNKLGMDNEKTVYGALALGYPDSEDGLPEREPLKRFGNEVTYIK